MEASIGYPKNQKDEAPTTNKRNGYSPKTVKSQYGEIPLEIPRDRNGESEPHIVPKHQRDISGTKDILSITVGANESSKFRMGMLNDLKNRGMRDVLFFCVEGLTGFKGAIAAA